SAMHARTAVLVTALLLALSSVALAQERFGALSGTVTDSSKLSVPGATVTVTNKQTGATRTTVSGADGTYRIQDLEPGRYGVTIELQGFQKVTADDVIVLLGKTFTVDAELHVGALTETVSVTGEVKQIDTKDVTLTNNVTSEEIERLPVARRSFQDIAMTQPGVN